MKVPFNSVSLKSSQLNFGVLGAYDTGDRRSLTAATSLMVITSPAVSWKEGTFTTSPFTSMCQAYKLAGSRGRLGAIPIRKTVLSRRASSNLMRFSTGYPFTTGGFLKSLTELFLQYTISVFGLLFFAQLQSAPKVLRLRFSPC